MYKIVVIGTGYVGLITGVCLAEKGNHIICIDHDKIKISSLKKGRSPIYENNLNELIDKNVKRGRIKFTSLYKDAYKNADFIFIAVGTPSKNNGDADLENVYKVGQEIAESLVKDCIIVLKSTVPIGTADRLESFITSNLKYDIDIKVVSNPEFLSQGTAIYDMINANRIVIGTNSLIAKEKMLKIYSSFDAPKIITDKKTSEMIKYASNSFLALKISYINEIANLCDILEIDIEEVSTGMSYDPRIGVDFLKSGVGYGGSCFPKDTQAIYNLALKNNCILKTIEAAINVNNLQKTVLIEKARKRFNSFKGVNVAILGLTFKGNTDDVRNSASVENIRILLDEGARIKAYDPIGIENFRTAYNLDIEYKNSIIETLDKTDVCFILTDWDEFENINSAMIIDHMNIPIVYDGRNILSKDNMIGVYYEGVGRKN